MLHLNLSIALLAGLIVFVSGVETAVNVSLCILYFAWARSNRKVYLVLNETSKLIKSTVMNIMH